MTKKERNAILISVSGLSDEQLKKEYYACVLSSLGSDCEKMYELGYDKRDIVEREKHEKFLCEKSDLLCRVCIQRGISLWDDAQ